MRFHSTKDSNLIVDFRQAVLSNMARDGGLWMPERVPNQVSFLGSKERYDLGELASIVLEPFTKDTISQYTLDQLCSKLKWEVPLVEVKDRVSALELFHGPTLSFKDFGATFLAGLLSEFLETRDSAITVLVATSGDTGSAVANAFLGQDGINVVVLFPADQVSPVQEMQFATLGQNITALKIDGSFDDCQALVKKAFADESLTSRVPLTSANSINVGRLLPQITYYMMAYLSSRDLPELIVSVPSGNFGNLTAGVLAAKMGVPIKKFIASTNANDTVPQYLKSGVYKPKKSVTTISNAMDVGDPSNFPRLRELYEENLQQMTSAVDGQVITDKETASTIHEVFDATGYVLDPHGAVGYCGLKKATKHYTGRAKQIFLHTAHPAKFPEVVSDIVGDKLVVPDSFKEMFTKKNLSIKMGNSYDELYEFLRRL